MSKVVESGENQREKPEEPQLQSDHPLVKDQPTNNGIHWECDPELRGVMSEANRDLKSEEFIPLEGCTDDNKVAETQDTTQIQKGEMGEDIEEVKLKIEKLQKRLKIEQNRVASYERGDGGHIEQDNDNESSNSGQENIESQNELVRKLNELDSEEQIDEDDLDKLNVLLIEIAVNKDKLEVERQRLEEEGRYAEAQLCLDKIKELNIVEGKKIESQVSQIIERKKKRLSKRHTLEVDAFESVWNQKIEEYDKQAKEILFSTIERQKWEKAETEKHIRSQLRIKKPKYSKKILDMRTMLNKLVKQKHYLEAEELRNQIRPQEILELEKFEKEQEITVKNKLKFVINQHQQELEALKQRIRQGKNELLVQRKADWKQLLQYHSNAMQDLSIKNRKVIKQIQKRGEGIGVAYNFHSKLLQSPFSKSLLSRSRT